VINVINAIKTSNAIKPPKITSKLEVAPEIREFRISGACTWTYHPDIPTVGAAGYRKEVLRY